MAARAYAGVRFDNTTTTAILEYITNYNAGGRKGKIRSPPSTSTESPILPVLPAYNDTDAATKFTDGLRSLANDAHPIDVPKVVDEHMIIAVAVNEAVCNTSASGPCLGPSGTRLSASLNNISFDTPTIDVLHAYYNNIGGVYGEEFPNEPPFAYNFTADSIPTTYWFPRRAAEVKVLEYNKTVEVVFQGTNILGGENHPMHLHGQSFYVVGYGFGNFDKEKDPLTYNLVDPPLQNTVGVPNNGWATIRFRTNNPGN
jgi:laccase